MKKIFVFVCLAFIALSFTMCTKETYSNQDLDELLAEINKDKEKLDSLQLRNNYLKDSLIYSGVLNNRKLFRTNEDEFSEITWYHTLAEPKYKGTNECFCYFSTKDNKPFNFRFVFQYYSSDWLFVKKMIFNIDGVNYEFKLDDVNRDVAYCGNIWERIDVCVFDNNIGNSYIVTPFNKDFILALANSNIVKVKLIGSDYYDIRTISKKQIQSIKTAIEYYIAIGGFNK